MLFRYRILYFGSRISFYGLSQVVVELAGTLCTQGPKHRRFLIVNTININEKTQKNFIAVSLLSRQRNKA
jgi:hypothetical protein